MQVKRFEVAAWTPKSSALDFIGAFDDGTKVTVITKEGVGYTYDFGKGSLIDENSLDNILDGSVGRYWVQKIKPNKKLIDKDVDAGKWNIVADTWLGDSGHVKAGYDVATVKDWCDQWSVPSIFKQL